MKKKKKGYSRPIDIEDITQHSNLNPHKDAIVSSVYLDDSQLFDFGSEYFEEDSTLYEGDEEQTTNNFLLDLQSIDKHPGTRKNAKMTTVEYSLYVDQPMELETPPRNKKKKAASGYLSYLHCRDGQNGFGIGVGL